MAAAETQQETDSLAALEQRIVQAAEIVTHLRKERDAAVAARQASEQEAAEMRRSQSEGTRELETLRNQCRKLTAEVETLRSERETVRKRVEKLLQQIDALQVS